MNYMHVCGILKAILVTKGLHTLAVHLIENQLQNCADRKSHIRVSIEQTVSLPQTTTTSAPFI